MKNASVVLFLAIFTGGCATQRVESVSTLPKGHHEGIYYTLPKLAFDVVVTSELIMVEPSAYFNNATDYETALRNLPWPISYYKEKKSELEVISIELSEVYLPDDKECYFIYLRRKNNPIIDKSFVYDLTPDGFLTQGREVSTNNGVSIGFSVLESSLAAVTTIFGGVPLALEKSVDSKDKNQELLTQIINKINQLYKAKVDIISGLAELDYPNAPVDVLVSELDKEIDSLVALLKGSKKVITKKEIIRVEPADNQALSLFNIKDAEIDFTGNDYQIQFAVRPGSRPLQDHIAAIKSNADEQKGLHYRIPASALVKVVCVSENKSYWEKQYLIPQLGETAFIPSRVGLFQNSITAGLDPKTGSLLHFEGNAKELDTDKLDASLKSLAEKAGELSKKEEETSEAQKVLNELEYKIQLRELQLKLDSLNRSE